MIGREMFEAAYEKQHGTAPVSYDVKHDKYTNPVEQSAYWFWCEASNAMFLDYIALESEMFSLLEILQQEKIDIKALYKKYEV